MSRKTLLILCIVAAIIIGSSFWYSESKKQTRIDSQKIEENREKIDTSDWQTYRNDEFRFQVKFPKDLAFSFKNNFDSSGGANMLFYENKYSDVASSQNPLLAIIDKNTSYLQFDINGNDFVKKPGFDIKQYLTPGISGPGGAIYATEKITQWTETKTIDGKTNIYFYTKEATDPNKTQSNGAAWISNGKLFILEVKNDTQGKMLGLYKQIALTFSYAQDSIAEEVAMEPVPQELVDYRVSELGIKFKIRKDLKEDLIYHYLSGNGSESIGFSLRSLKDSGEDCKPDKGPLGFLVKLKGRITDYDQYVKSRVLKQFPGFIVIFDGPQAPCTDLVDMNAVMEKATNTNKFGTIGRIKESLELIK